MTYNIPIILRGRVRAGRRGRWGWQGGSRGRSSSSRRSPRARASRNRSRTGTRNKHTNTNTNCINIYIYIYIYVTSVGGFAGTFPTEIFRGPVRGGRASRKLSPSGKRELSQLGRNPESSQQRSWLYCRGSDRFSQATFEPLQDELRLKHHRTLLRDRRFRVNVHDTQRLQKRQRAHHRKDRKAQENQARGGPPLRSRNEVERDRSRRSVEWLRRGLLQTGGALLIIRRPASCR